MLYINLYHNFKGIFLFSSVVFQFFSHVMKKLYFFIIYVFRILLLFVVDVVVVLKGGYVADKHSTLAKCAIY